VDLAVWIDRLILTDEFLRQQWPSPDWGRSSSSTISVCFSHSSSIVMGLVYSSFKEIRQEGPVSLPSCLYFPPKGVAGLLIKINTQVEKALHVVFFHPGPGS
jgi:hypothetical protein